MNAVAQAFDVLTGFFNDRLDARHEFSHGVGTPEVLAIKPGGRRTKVGCHFIELLLRPVGKGMVMALSAGDIGTEENSQCVRQIVERHTRITQEIPRSAIVGTVRFLVPHFSCSRNHVRDHLIPWAVFGDLFLQPANVWRAPDVIGLELVHHSKHLGEVIVEIGFVTIRVQQHVDKLRTLGFVSAFDEGTGFVVIRNAPSDVEIDAADELLVIGHRVKALDRSFARLCALRICLDQTVGNKLIHLLSCLSHRRIGHHGWGVRVGRCRCFHGFRGFGDRLILSGETGKSELMQGSIRRLEDNVITFDFNEGGVHLATLDVSPHAGFREGGTRTETRGEKAR